MLIFTEKNDDFLQNLHFFLNNVNYQLNATPKFLNKKINTYKK